MFSEPHNRPSQPLQISKKKNVYQNRRGSSHDVRDQSPEHGTMGRKQRLVLFLFCCCCWCEFYYFCMCNPECYVLVHKSNGKCMPYISTNDSRTIWSKFNKKKTLEFNRMTYYLEKINFPRVDTKLKTFFFDQPISIQRILSKKWLRGTHAGLCYYPVILVKLKNFTCRNSSSFNQNNENNV